jgi:hypothetical protein
LPATLETPLNVPLHHVIEMVESPSVIQVMFIIGLLVGCNGVVIVTVGFMVSLVTVMLPLSTLPTVSVDVTFRIFAEFRLRFTLNENIPPASATTETGLTHPTISTVAPALVEPVTVILES